MDETVNVALTAAEMAWIDLLIQGKWKEEPDLRESLKEKLDRAIEQFPQEKL